MIRGFFRLVGLLLLAGSFIFVVYDGARWVADQTLQFTRFGQLWNDVHQSSQAAFRAWWTPRPRSCGSGSSRCCSTSLFSPSLACSAFS